MKRVLLALCILFSSSITRSQIIVHFTPTGAGNHDGASWANAKPGTELAHIMRFYYSYVQLWVAAGTYKPNAAVRDSSFFINSSLRVYGGFNGTETSISQRNWVANPTILSGDIGLPGDTTDNAYHVVQFLNADSTTVLDGFIIEHGNANVSSSTWDNMGGGIRSSAYGILGTNYGSPKVSNCVIRNNFADYGGGGIADFAGGVLEGMRVDNCTFENNHSGLGGRGGGAFLSFSFTGDGPLAPVLDHCIFRNNSTQSGAGGVSLVADFDNSATIHIKSCTFENNFGINAGALAIGSSTDPYSTVHTAVLKTYIDSCRFTHNTSTIGGSSIIGASYNVGSPVISHELHITHCVIDSNTSSGAPVNIQGFASRTRNFIEHCSFSHNVTQDVGGINISSSNGNIDSTYVNNSLFHNTGHRGIYYATAQTGSQSYSFINNTTAYVDSSRFGGPICIINSGAVNNTSSIPCNAAMYINNSILWHCRPSYLTVGVAGINSFHSGSNTTSSTIVKNSVVNMDNNTWPVPNLAFGQPDYGVNAGGNKGVYPRFRDTAHFDFRLTCGSPAINAGNNTLIPAGMTNDLDGHARIINTTVDMGCYEVATLPTPVATPSVAVNGRNINCTAGYNMQPDSVRWTFGDGQTSNQVNPLHTYAANGTYIVCLHIYTACGQDEKCDTVTIAATGITTAGNSLDKVNVYPNPTKDQLYISGISGMVSVKLMTLTGSMLQEVTLTQNNAQLDISKLPSGIYMIQLTSGASGRRIIKVVKE